MPFPSCRCQTCKGRRIKCDELHPVCSQCKKSGRICTWLDLEASTLPIRNENIYAGGVARRPRRKKNSSNSTRTRSGSSVSCNQTAGHVVSSDLPSASLVLETDWSSIIRRGMIHQTQERRDLPQSTNLSFPIEVRAFDFYVRWYLNILEPHPVSSAHFNSIRFDCNVPDPHTILGNAVSAVSLAVFARTQGKPKILSASNQRYIQTLSSVRSVISDTKASSTDQVLLTVMLLIAYESITGAFQSHILESETWPHHDGAFAMLKARKGTPNQTPEGILIDRAVRQQMVRFSILRGVMLPEVLQNGADFGEHGLELELDNCMVQVATLRCKAVTLWKQLRSLSLLEIQTSQTDAQGIYDLASRLDNRLASWSANLPSTWSYSTTSRADHTLLQGNVEYTSLFHSNAIHLYPNLYTAVLWNRYRACRLITLNIIGKLKNYGLWPVENKSDPFFALFGDKTYPDEVQTTMDALVDDLCASVPYVLGLFVGPENEDEFRKGVGKVKGSIEKITGGRAYLLCFPLCIAIHVLRINPTQRTWLSNVLLLVSRITGSCLLERIARQKLVELDQV